MAKVMRMVAVWIASVQTVMAMATSARRILPSVSPRVLMTMYGRPPAYNAVGLSVFVAISANRSRSVPAMPATPSA